jgi:thermostable 8-oxoguanine DNA glycosylase
MKQNTEELWTNFGTNVKAAKLNFMKITTANRKVRYGWYNNSSSADEFSVVKKEDLEYQLKDPEERVRFNENKAWAGKFVLCPGQKTLCRLL